MAFQKRTMAVLLMIFICMCEVSMGAVYKVGDSAGWTGSGKVDYKAWSSSKTFHVGDTIVFKYNNRFSNVVRVNHEGYYFCNYGHPYFTLNSGNDSFTIPKPGHYYFITTFPACTSSGQKVDIRVPKDTVISPPVDSPKWYSSSSISSSESQVSSPKGYPSMAPSRSQDLLAKEYPSKASSESQAPSPQGYPSMVPSGSQPPAPKKDHSVAVSISGMWFAITMAIAVSFYMFAVTEYVILLV